MRPNKHSQEIAKLSRKHRAPRPKHVWHPVSVLACPPGWRVVLEHPADEPNGTPRQLVIHEICMWVMNEWGRLDPCYFDSFIPVLAGHGEGRIVGILPPGQHEPMAEGDVQGVDLEPAPVLREAAE